MRGVILAAGFGTRLWPLTEDRTKPAIPFLSRPLIAYSVEYLASHGIRDLVVNLHHQPESIRAALGDGRSFGVKIHYSFEEQILGTSGALDRVRDQLMDSDFAVMNGKIVTTIDLKAAIRAHQERKAVATLVLIPNAGLERFSEVEVDEQGLIRAFLPPPEPATRRTSPDVPLLFTGIQILAPRIFDYIPRGVFSHSTSDIYPKAIDAGETVLGHVATGQWFEMSTLARYLDASIAFMHREGKSFIGGPGSNVQPGASVADCVLWENVTVESGASLSRCIVGAGVRIKSGEKFDGVAIVRKEIVREVEGGYVSGDNLVAPID